MKHERLHVEVAALCSVFVASGKYIPSSVAMLVYGIEFLYTDYLQQQNHHLLKRDPLPRPWCQSFFSSADRPVHQSAEFSSFSKNNDRLGRRAKEKLLDRV